MRISQRTAKPSKSQLKFAISLLIALFALSYQQAFAAQFDQNSGRIQRISGGSAPVAMPQISVSLHELALLQVLSEMCPQMLNRQQLSSFNRAYNQQLRSFLPNTNNPQQTLRQLTAQRNYRAVLHNVRTWTVNYPMSENRALCQEFAQRSVR